MGACWRFGLLVVFTIGFFLGNVEAEEFDTTSLANLEGVPSSMVDGCVNVVTGDYCEFNTDIAFPGISGLAFQRSYISSEGKNGSLCCGWHGNHYSSAVFQFEHVDPKGERGRGIIQVKEPMGSRLFYKSKVQNYNRDFLLKLPQEAIDEGFTNCGRGKIGGDTNPKNNIVIYDSKSQNLTMQTGAGDIYKYHLKGKKGKVYSLGTIKHANQHQSHYYYDEDHYLRNVLVRNAAGKHIGLLKLSHKHWKSKLIKLDVVLPDDRCLQYHFTTSPCEDYDHYTFLSKVINPTAPEIDYLYSEFRGLKFKKTIKLSTKSLPEGRCRKIGYYQKKDNDPEVGENSIEDKNDFRLERVAFLKAPVGNSADPIYTHRFFYHKRNETDGWTSVHNARDNVTTYEWSKNRLIEVRRYPGGEEQPPHSLENYYWGKEKTADAGNLLTRSVKSPNQHPEVCRSFVYDAAGNVIEDRYYGNHSGQSTIPIVLNEMGFPEENGAEAYVKKFQYIRNQWNLLVREEEGPRVISYRYKPDSNIVTAKFISEGSATKIRNFYSHDENGAVILEITDDGFGEWEGDLTGVTERHFIVTEARKEHPVGLPMSVEHRCLDRTTGQERLLTRKEYAYTKEGWVAEERLYDAERKHAGTTLYEYNHMGQVTRMVNPLGEEGMRAYDANGNMIYEQGPRLELHKEFVYDYSNRLLSEEEVYSDGMRLTKRYSYDLLSQKIKETDIYGNETKFVYDNLDRLDTKIMPPIFLENGACIQPQERQLYNILDQPIGKIDGRGHLTSMSVTPRGKPYKIAFPDGTSEHLYYNLDGTLREKIGKNGLKTLITYDYQERPLEKKVYSPDGNLLYQTNSEYNSFHLIREVDAAGNVTRYEYDDAGRKSRMMRGDKEARYVYDALGRLSKTINMVSETESIVECKEYDLLGRNIEERVEDGQGRLQSHVCYRYDCDGNKIQTITFSIAGVSVEQDEYNAHGDLTKHIDAEGRASVTQYRYDYVNEHGQIVGYREITDPMGNILVVIKDAHGRDAMFERKDAFGETTLKYKLYYDADGNKTARVETVINEGKAERETITRWEYDSNNKVVKIIEACGTQEQQETKIGYNSEGEKAFVIKADGTLVSYEHDVLGRLVRYASSKGDIEYCYEYDLLNQPVKIDDLVNKRSTCKSYDLNGCLLTEVQGNGLEVRYAYDRMGRKKALLMPDGSGVEYEYEGLNLKRILRKGNDGSIAYCHEYLQYDLSGNIVETRLVGQAGTVRYDYDLLGRVRSIENPCWSETITGFNEAGKLLARKVEDVAGTIENSYAYDALYQLQSEKGGFMHSYSYDSLNNRTSKDGSGYSLNALNQVLSSGEEDLCYDLNGNLISREGARGSWKYSYDSLGRLVAAQGEGLKVAFAYDETNRRLSKQVYQLNDGGEEELIRKVDYLYEGKHDIGTVDSDGRIMQLRILGEGLGAEIGAAVALELEGEVYAVIHDHNGNVATLLEAATGGVFEAYRYSAFGEEEIYESLGQKLERSSNPWRFSSKRYDEEIRYVYFGQRYYDPVLGRWITPDPIGHEDGPNLYAYLKNSPLTNFDLWGEMGYYLSDFALDDPWEGINFSRDSSYILAPLRRWVNSDFERRLGGPESIRYNYEGDFTKPLPKDKGIAIANGMCTPYSTAMEGADYISKLSGGYAIQGVWNATHGGLMDFFESSGNLLVHAMTPPCFLLQQQWNEFFLNSSKNAIFLQICHSQGAILVRNALENYPEELRKRIIVIAIAPGAYISSDLCHTAHHYVSDCDFVPLFDGEGRVQCKDTIHYLKRHKNASYWDHDFLSPTYLESIQIKINNYMNNIY